MPDFGFPALNRSALGRAPWSPLSMGADLVLWLDAATAATQEGPVAAWPDRSGQGRDAVQASPALRPSWRHDAARGRGMLRFQSQDMTLPNLGLARDLSAFWVMAPDARGATSAYPIYLFLDGSSFDGQGRKPMLHGLPTSPGLLLLQIGNTGTSHAVVPGAVQLGGIVSRAGRIESALNGAEPVVQTHQTVLSASAATGRIGAPTSQCDWGELIVLDRDVAAAERQRIEGYLAHRWACAHLLPPSHPHAADAP